MKKRLLSFIVVLIMAVSLMQAFTFATTQGEFLGGSGTESDPYLISTKAHLDNVHSYLDAHFKMLNDIDLQGENFTPIGTDYYNPFTGTFDGNGFVIKNLRVRNTNNDDIFHAGLFAASSGEIKNLGIKGVNIDDCSGMSLAGAFVGYGRGGNITNCYAEGGYIRAYAPTTYMGGIVGISEGTTIENCYNTVTVALEPVTMSLSCADEAYVGGIAGDFSGGKIINCYNLGDIESNALTYAYAGGIAGSFGGRTEKCYNAARVFAEAPYAYAGGITGRGYGTIENCYNTGCVQADRYSGGISGYASAADIQKCYNTGEVAYYQSSNGWLGGIAGYKSNGTVTDCYFVDTSSSGAGNTDGIATKCTAEQMTQKSTYVGFDFESVWKFGTAPTPVLRLDPNDIPPSNTIEFSGGRGSIGDPYLISTKEHLNNVRNYPDAHFKMLNDIDLQGEQFVPIGDIENPFTGTFDGGNFAVKNLCINLSSEDSLYVGLFGANFGTIKNLGIQSGRLSVDAKAQSFIGGITGMNCGTIENCYNSADIYTSAPGIVYEGGITGFNDEDGVIRNCYNLCDGGLIAGIANDNFGEVIGCYNKGSVGADREYAGGLVIENWGSIKDSYNLGKVSGNYSGGIAYYNWGTIERCYNAGDVTGDMAGGIAQESDGEIKDCYNAGHIYGYVDEFSIQVAGIVTWSGGTITNCYNVGKLSVYNCYDYNNASIDEFIIGGFGCDSDSVNNCFYPSGCRYVNNKVYYSGSSEYATKCTSKQMQNSETFQGFDFENVWEIRDGSLYPYPVLKGLPMYDFTDVTINAWYKQYVDYAVENGIFSGKGDGKFAPDANITRAEFVQVLANITGTDLAEYKTRDYFSDVKSTAWYSGAVNWAYENGIVSGMGYGTFKPSDKITREQMCVMLVNYVEKHLKSSLNQTTIAPTFADDGKISSWAKTAVYKCANAGLVSGVGDGKFDPSANATRAQGATIFTNFHKLYM